MPTKPRKAKSNSCRHTSSAVVVVATLVFLGKTDTYADVYSDIQQLAPAMRKQTSSWLGTGSLTSPSAKIRFQLVGKGVRFRKKLPGSVPSSMPKLFLPYFYTLKFHGEPISSFMKSWQKRTKEKQNVGNELVALLAGHLWSKKMR